jgi:serine O-acetyltransferase
MPATHAVLTAPPPKTHADVWPLVVTEAQALAEREPRLAALLRGRVLDRRSIEDALVHNLARIFATADLAPADMQGLFDEAVGGGCMIGCCAAADLMAVRRRDPACRSHVEPLLFAKGFLALQGYRISHWFWRHDRRLVAHYLQSRISEVLGVDIHPAAQIGCGIMIDHATGVVIGETAVVEDNVSMLHEVTLGGTGKETGDRHPKIRQGAMIGAGTKVLGNVEIGRWTRIGAGSVVLGDVPAYATVVGVPARIVSSADRPAVKPAEDMNQLLPGCDCRLH